jgi:hypothetical protein
MADEHLNGKLELGKLDLSLWGQVKVEVGGLKLTDSAGRSVVSVNDAYVQIPFMSLLGGSPELNLKMENPVLLAVKDKSGKLNVSNLVKTESQPSGAAQPSQTQKAPPSNEPVKVPGIAARAKLGLELLNATMTYKDESSGLTSNFKNLNLVAKDLSLSHPSDIKLWSDLDTKMGKVPGKETQVRGPAVITAKLSPTVSGGKLERFELTGNANLDDLEITVPGTFEKKKGIPANADLALSGSEKEVKIEKINAKFFNAEIKSSGTISHLEDPANASVQYQVSSNSIELKPWTELIPMLKEYQLGGNAKFSAVIGGLVSKLSYQAKLGVNDVTAKAPMLKAEPRINGTIDVTTDQIENMVLTVRAPGNDLTVKGKVLSFTAPQVMMDVVSNSLDLDQLVDWSKKKAAVNAQAEQKPEAGKATPASARASDMDAMLEPLRTNPVLQKLNANINVNMKSIRAQGVKIENLESKLTMKDLVAGMEHLTMRLFNGAVKSSFSANLKPKAPTYHFTAGVSGMDMGEAVKSQMASLKNTVTGKANFDMTGEGVSFNPEPAKQNLKAKGSFKVQNAQFTTIDVSKMVTEALNGSMSQLASKVPGLGGKKIGNLPEKGMKYELISSDFGISNGRFSAPNFVAKAEPNQGIDLKGSVQVGLKDMSLKANWEVADTYNLTHAKDISVNQGGIDIKHILAEGNGPVQFPVNVGCTLIQPCFDYGAVPAFLSKVALNNAGSAAKSRLKSEAGNQLQKALGNHAPPALKDKLKGLFGQ